jgi:sugar/nucleoside kinase (ribokinase family)
MEVAGIGCCLIDHVYTNFTYENEGFQKLLSKKGGDGGIIPGGLVFAEDVETFAARPFPQILSELVGDMQPTISNLGGPSVVAMVHASQILADLDVRVRFFGAIGTDSQGEQIKGFLNRTPLSYELKEYPEEHSPSTVVLADPSQHGGKGERSFINTLGAARIYSPEDVPEEFFTSDIVLCGGTALVPRLHDGLGNILEKAKRHGCITVVGTVYDFRNEKANPQSPWPLGGPNAYHNIDVLITDAEEALRLSGKKDLIQAAEEFISYGIGSLFITHGAKEILLWSKGTVFKALPLTAMPVSAHIDDILEAHPNKRKDTTGCGDNFVGGVISSICMQLQPKPEDPLDIREACAWGAASGGFTCMYHGGTYYEQEAGIKRKEIEPIVAAYRQQIGL